MKILQGTTPSLEIKIDPGDFAVDDVVKFELVFSNNGTKTVHNLDDVAIDTVNNSFTYQFTEAETLALTPTACLYWQMRCGFANGSIVGTDKASIDISDLMAEAVMDE